MFVALSVTLFLVDLGAKKKEPPDQRWLPAHQACKVAKGLPAKPFMKRVLLHWEKKEEIQNWGYLLYYCQKIIISHLSADLLGPTSLTCILIVVKYNIILTEITKFAVCLTTSDPQRHITGNGSLQTLLQVTIKYMTTSLFWNWAASQNVPPSFTSAFNSCLLSKVACLIKVTGCRPLTWISVWATVSQGSCTGGRCNRGERRGSSRWWQTRWGWRGRRTF